jgi:hypothetical protein
MPAGNWTLPLQLGSAAKPLPAGTGGMGVATSQRVAGLAWRGRPSVVAIAVFALLLPAVVSLQVRAHAYNAEFATDEASHYISGLLVHDYLVSGLAAPMAFLRRFSSHYPLVGIGHWGPVYYAAEAVWMLLFGCSRTAVLLLSAGVTAAIGTAIVVLARPRCGLGIAVLLAVAFLLAPVTQDSSAELMLDAPIALVSLAAMVVYARFLDAPSVGRAIGFALLAVAGILMKGNALCLALLPPFALLIGRRWRLLRRPVFWLPLPIVALGIGPWYAVTLRVVTPGFRYAWGLHYFAVATVANGALLLAAMGPLLLAAGVAGWLLCVRWPREARCDSVMACAAALVASVWLFQSVVPAAIQDRYLLPALPPLLLLGGLALRRGGDWLRARHAGPMLPALAALLCLTSVAVVGWRAERKAQLGFIAAAPQVWAALPPRDPAVLVVAGAVAEGAAIAELALHDPHRPSLFVVRGSRLLGGGGYNNADYLPRYQTTAQVMAAIDAYRIPLVLFRSDGRPDEWAHVRQVAAAAAADPARWQVIWRGDTDGHPVVLYRIAGNADQGADTQRLTALSAPRALGGAAP